MPKRVLRRFFAAENVVLCRVLYKIGMKKYEKGCKPKLSVWCFGAKLLLGKHRKFKIEGLEILDQFIDKMLSPFYIKEAEIFGTLLQAVFGE